MKLGFIGAGNMATAIIKGVVASEIAEEIWVSDTSAEKLSQMQSLGIKRADSNIETVQKADVIIMAVKPNVCPLVLEEIKDALKDKLLISIAAGISLSFMKDRLLPGAKIIRTMPNTPAMVGEGMTVLTYEEPVDEEDFQRAKSVFDGIGKTAYLPEKMMDMVTAVSGSSPAYVFMMIEAMVDAAVQGGIPRDTAYLLCAQAVLGSAKMVLETKKHPGELKDMVCSPGGTTIDAVHQLEADGFRAAMMNAVNRCAEKSKKMTK